MNDNSENEKRPVKFKAYIERKGNYLSSEGTFHGWGKDVTYHDEKYMPVTFAIVEDNDGTVYRVPEDGIQFTDRGPLVL